MKLKEVLNNLRNMDFINTTSSVTIALTRKRSFNKDDIVCTSFMPIDIAERFYGDLEVILNKIRNNEDGYSRFWFLISLDENK